MSAHDFCQFVCDKHEQPQTLIITSVTHTSQKGLRLQSYRIVRLAQIHTLRAGRWNFRQETTMGHCVEGLAGMLINFLSGPGAFIFQYLPSAFDPTTEYVTLLERICLCDDC